MKKSKKCGKADDLRYDEYGDLIVEINKTRFTKAYWKDSRGWNRKRCAHGVSRPGYLRKSCFLYDAN